MDRPLKPEREGRHDDAAHRIPVDDEDVVAHALPQRRDGDEEQPGEAELEEDHGHVRHHLPPFPGKVHVIALLSSLQLTASPSIARSHH